ncbi:MULTISPECIES: YegS/Rv2252/BmrU family lipid kinase [unclassified Coleofasciculus]|uniref:YegS/Rv2252/BmrU family lipid kinase n=1 Tax=unclassified Coleofasciculus TaxID=2692782 RepID=UPI00188135F9|nr:MULTISPECIES: YegS/Rv2252/BmrU family lipid kinase [unclassified Coleofasciculus]MBE9127064.1 YegS/Rv2252/BmrU family lipid kinase [Coleofasciculus sp. LEGE 07081]MBE9150452.1 YegS/Rv2252/BmrU family lipid kinase [Coleofasciculus sp. LEGE 07092]
MTQCACLIFTPTAGQSDTEQDLEAIQGILLPKLQLDIRLTTLEVKADKLAREAVEQGFNPIIASGGDGTVSAVAGALIGTNITFGVIPRGTANAFATSLGIPTTIEEACETILYGNPRVIDAAFCNGKPMITLAGIGFEADATEKADRNAKEFLGVFAYVIADVQELSKGVRSFKTYLEADEQVFTFDAAAVTIANAAPIFSIFAQGPAEVVVDDGLLDVTIVAPANVLDAIASGIELFQTAMRGTAVERPDTAYLQAKHIKVTTEPPQKVVLDGELMDMNPVEVECIPGGLTVLVPATRA